MIGASRVILAVVLAGAATLFAGLAIMSGFRRAERKNTADGGDMDLGELAQSAVVRGSQVDVGRTRAHTRRRRLHADVARPREHTRRRRLWKLFVYLAPISAFFYYRLATKNPIRVGMPS